MKFSELKGRAVVDLEDARKIGEVEDLIVEPDGHSIVSLKVKTGLFQAAKLVPVTDVKNVGADAVTISGSAGKAQFRGGQFTGRLDDAVLLAFRQLTGGQQANFPVPPPQHVTINGMSAAGIG